LYNIYINNNRYNEYDIDIIFPDMSCEYNGISHDSTFAQIERGIRDYHTYSPVIIDEYTILYEPTLADQPKYLRNADWFDITI
jgi:hypothetical protein